MPRVDEKGDQATKTTQQRPKPKPPKHRDTYLPKPHTEGQEQARPTTRSRKRQLDHNDADSGDKNNDNEAQLKRARLTRKNLAFFDKMAQGKKTSTPVLSKSTTRSTTKSISTTSTNFAIQAYENGILEPGFSKPPQNLEDIRKRYALSRTTPSPTASAYGDYINTVEGAGNEATMVFEVGKHLLKKYPKGYRMSFDRAFTGFPKDVGFNNGLSIPQPDFVQGLEMREFQPFPIHNHISGPVLYQDDPHSVTLPHLAGEWKGPGKNMIEARLQSAYNGAALVYARNQALSYLGEADPPSHAEVMTFTTDGTNLQSYAHYAARSEDDGTLQYHQYPVASKNLLNSHQEHNEGRRGIRNEQDYARHISYDLRDQLKNHWKQSRGDLQVIKGGTPPSADGAFEEANAALCCCSLQPWPRTRARCRCVHRTAPSYVCGQARHT